MKQFLLLTFALAPLLAQSHTLSCDAPAQPGDTREIECAIPGAAQRLSFKALFAGGHDDTSASMTLNLDGTPLACDPGSKTKLFAEDGNVFLECRFSLDAGAAPRKLGVALVWSHAQYTGVELKGEDR